MIGRGNDDGVYLVVIQQLSEIAIALHGTAHERLRLLKSSAVDLGDRQAMHIGLGLKVQDVSLADQAKADEANPQAFVRAKDASIARCR